jgi:hypothetical protein
VGHTVFVDGFMAGLWWVRDGRVVTDVFGELSTPQRRELSEEVERVEDLLAR